MTNLNKKQVNFLLSHPDIERKIRCQMFKKDMAAALEKELLDRFDARTTNVIIKMVVEEFYDELQRDAIPF